MIDRREHWEQVYRSKSAGERSWFQPDPEISLELIERAACGPSSRILDVGGGTSHLVDALLARGYRHVSVLDISALALEEARARLGTKASEVRWIEADISSASLTDTFDLWHDRAVFHFLTEKDARNTYVRTLKTCLRPDAHAIIATFAEDGPAQCSGLPVVRYSPNALLAELGSGVVLVETCSEIHRTPAGREQSFVYCLFRFENPNPERRRCRDGTRTP